LRKPPLTSRMQEKILILDGAMGTMIQRFGLTAADFGGEALEGCNEMLNVTRPDLIRSIHEAYLEAGADIIETNTFGATRIVLSEYGIAERARELNLAAARLAVEAAERYSSDVQPRYVAGSMGPTTRTLSVTGGVTFEQLVDAYYEQALALIEGGVDALLLETSQDTLNVKAGGVAIRRAFERAGKELPIMISGTIEPMGTTLAGQNIEAFYVSIEHLSPISVGLNCATGPEFMKDHIRTLAGIAKTAVSCYPNAGLPDENGHYHESPESLAKKLAAFAREGWLNIAGGCCGTTPEHIRAIARALEGIPPRIPAGFRHPAVSGIDVVYFEPDNRPLLVGERTNVLGSAKFKRLIAEGKYEEAAEIARAQVKSGAHIIDVCLQDPDRNEIEDLKKFLEFAVKKVKVPFVIDTTDPAAMEVALRMLQGKAIINSINLEDGEEKFKRVCPLLREYGAAVVVGAIDERGQAVQRGDKLAVARRAYELLTKKYGIAAEDIIFDPLVFPIGTGDAQYAGSAVETIEGLRMIKREMPACATILGISNVSFGLPDAGREVLNAVFLYHCTEAGLDLAIVNTQKLQRYASIPKYERKLAERLIFEPDDKILTEFVEYFRSKKKEKRSAPADLTLEQRLARYVVEGSKEGLFRDLEEALKVYKPLDIINGPLMAGMEEVGKLFNRNELIVAEVLQSAEVMKAAVAYLEPHMEKKETAVRGTILLATVKGDVHDIGKNLVEIILSNNGYRVVDLGIKVPPEQLIEAYHREKPDAIGLSGLLVKSAQQMVVTAQDLKAAGIDVPLLVGGAALTRKFTETRIQPEYDGPVLYAKDAMEGLELANKLIDPETRRSIIDRLRRVKQSDVMESGKKSDVAARRESAWSTVSRDAPVFVPRDLKRHILRDYPLDYLYPYVNFQMLLGHHLGLKGKVEQLLAERDPKAIALKETVDAVFREAKELGWIRAHGMYRFFPAQSEGDDILIYDPDGSGRVLERFCFPRQPSPPYLCLADFVKPVESGVMDYVGFFVVTAGHGVRERAEQWKKEGDYLRSHILQAFALELAEGFAERLHQIMRDVWGFPDPPSMTMRERFAARYQGIRVSFGYPACPNLEDQAVLFRLMQPEDIGVRLTEGFMMEPEASVSAMVFAHPEARYFNVDTRQPD